MSSSPNAIPILTKDKTHTLTPLEQAFISAYVISKNGAQAVIEAGYKSKRPSQYASALLSRDYIRSEILARLQEIEDAKTAKPAEILQFYTSVMRGEVLDQFGIEASLDTRIKAANELAKHQIELPMKLEQKNMSNNIGSITLNFLPRTEIEVGNSDE
jgi:phage terminase small subunit